MTKLISEDEARKMLGKAVKGSPFAFSKANGVSHTVVSLSLAGKRTLSPTVAKAIGLDKVTAYKRSDPDEVG